MFGAQLDDEPASHNEYQADPGRGGDIFAKDKLAEKDGGRGKKGDVNAKNCGEVPIHRINDQTVTSDSGDPKQDKNWAVAL